MTLASPTTGAERLAQIASILDTIPDPEIPVISIRELGILRSVRLCEKGEAADVEVIITPTYSGCPAIGQMEDDIRTALASNGFTVTLTMQLSPAWTTEWISPLAREKLRAYGIAPPHATSDEPSDRHQKVIHFASNRIANNSISKGTLGPFNGDSVECPQCGSVNTTETSHFGSTACKALYRCLDCREPFDYFKPY